MVVLDDLDREYGDRNVVGADMAAHISAAVVGGGYGCLHEHFLYITYWSSCCHHKQGM